MTTIQQNTANGLKGDPDRLYALLPLVYRQRDAEEGYVLRGLLRVVAEQVEVVEDDIAQLYENWFIETCDDWVIPYIGETVGIGTMGRVDGGTDERVRARGRHLLPRAQVADGIRALRRKGTLAILEEIARTSADWHARAVEFYRLIGWHQHTRFSRPGQGATADVRDGKRLEYLGTPFDTLAHTIDVRRPGSLATPGLYNVPSVALFLWRLRPYPINRAMARRVEGTQGAYTFSILGNDCALFNEPTQGDNEVEMLAEPTALPVRITRRLLEQRITDEKGVVRGVASPDFYGAEKSIAIYAPGWPTRNAPQPIPAQQILVTDLSGWRYEIPRGFIGLDPETGRILFPKGQVPTVGSHVYAHYRYGFSADMGGGEYLRHLSNPDHARIYRVGKDATPAESEGTSPRFNTPSAALERWRADRAADANINDEPGKPLSPTEYARKHFPTAVIEIEDSEEYADRFEMVLVERETLILRGADGARPVLRLLDYLTDQSDALSVSGTTGSRLLLDGLWVIGRGLVVRGNDPQADENASASSDGIAGTSPYATRVTQSPTSGDGYIAPAQSLPPYGEPPAPDSDPKTTEPPKPLPPFEPLGLCEVRIRHCTLVPGWGLRHDCDPLHPDYPSIELEDTETRIVVEQSILGSIQVTVRETRQEPVTINLSDSILDATSNDRYALGSGDGLAYARLTVERCTIFGTVDVHAIALAEDTLFCGNLRVARRQEGCLRFCYVSYGSRTPRRFQCQPDGVTHDLPEEGSEIEEERRRVTPRFVSTRYGAPTYAQLARDCAPEITQGAEDESEMGAFHDLYQPQREAILRRRTDEYTPEDRNTGLIFVN